MAATDYTVEQVLSLAPDTSSASSARGLATPRKWVSLGHQAPAVWGECQGSGSSPYQTRIDLSEPAFKCSCPSRKFPCKHGLALLLLYASQRAAFKESEPPGWVSEWLASRTAREEKKAERAEVRAAKEADPVQQAKRAERRENRVDAGIQELGLWLHDAVRRGLAALQGEPFSFWDRMAARLVDAQAPGLGRMVRELPALLSSGPDSHSRVLKRLARLHLLVRAWENMDSLPPEVREDVRSLVGFTFSREQLMERESIADDWVAWCQYEEQLDDGLRLQRSWLWGLNSNRKALVLAFAPRGGIMEPGFVPGMSYRAELVYFPSAAPQRALIKSRDGTPSAPSAFPAYASLRDAFDEFGAMSARCPWIELLPLALRDGRVAVQASGPFLVDSGGNAAPVKASDETLVLAMAITGGHPATWFGEWDGEALAILCTLTPQGFVKVAR